MPRIEDIEYTPNPNARKIIVKEPLTAPGVSLNFSTAAEAASDPLAEALFAIPHVTNVFIMDRFVTISKDNEIGWDDLLRQVAIPIRAAASIHSPQEPVSTYVKGVNPTLDRINEILDQRIRPGLAGDGGGLMIMGFEEHKLQVRYQGACGSCPSSISGTLYAIQNILRMEVDPALEVVAV
ncbi:MAG: NifU family protein [Blastocatellia bacterium]|nr:NifU family protein [Blastocatellia bacterium]